MEQWIISVPELGKAAQKLHDLTKMQLFKLIPLTILWMVIGITKANITVYHFKTPGLCPSNSSFDMQYLLSSSSVKTRAECAEACAGNSKCRSLTVIGNHPHVSCKLFIQSTNKFGVHLTPSPDSVYFEKPSLHRRQDGTCEKPPGVRLKPECTKRSSTLELGEIMFHGDMICTSGTQDSQYKALLQEADGNFVVIKTASNSIMWSTELSGFPSHHVQLLPDGNLVVQDENDNVGWSSDRLGVATRMRMKSGHLVVENQSDGSILWLSEW